ARATITRDRPIILLELLAGTHQDPAAYTVAICEDFSYDAFIVQQDEKIAALPAIRALGKNTSWGTSIASRNVLFLPRSGMPAASTETRSPNNRPTANVVWRKETWRHSRQLRQQASCLSQDRTFVLFKADNQ